LCVARLAAAQQATYFAAVSSLFISYDLRQTIITRIISKSTCPIFAKFSALVELWFR